MRERERESKRKREVGRVESIIDILAHFESERAKNYSNFSKLMRKKKFSIYEDRLKKYMDIIKKSETEKEKKKERKCKKKKKARRERKRKRKRRRDKRVSFCAAHKLSLNF